MEASWGGCGGLPGEAALGAKCEWVRAGVAGGARRCVFVLAGGRILGWTWRTRGMFLFRRDEGSYSASSPALPVRSRSAWIEFDR